MIVTTANGVFGPQDADSRDAEKNNFSVEPNAASDDPREPDPQAKQPQHNQPRRDKRDVHGWVVLDKPIGMTSTHAVAVVKRLFQAKRAGMPARSIRLPPAACRLRLGKPPRRFHS